MREDTARRLAIALHGRSLDRFGARWIDHLARVAAMTPPPARAVAWLHDALEQTPATPALLRRSGATDDEVRAVVLLTRPDGLPHLDHARRIVAAGGRAGAMARAVKLADAIDRLRCRGNRPGLPPYAAMLDIVTGGRHRLRRPPLRPRRPSPGGRTPRRPRRPPAPRP